MEPALSQAIFASHPASAAPLRARRAIAVDYAADERIDVEAIDGAVAVDVGVSAASTSEINRFETETLSLRRNLTALMDLSGAWIDCVHECAPLDGLILDMDSSQSEANGDQQGSACNGYFLCTCYHPLFLFIQHGD
jgi:hypothetical protein